MPRPLKNRLLKGGAATLALLTASACATATPAPLVEAVVVAPEGWRAETVSGPAVEREWWTAFGDPHLTALVERALVRNTDLALAEARLREAEALSVQARSALLPSLNLSVAGQDARSLSPLGQPSESASIQPQLQAAYEVDLWGRVRASDAAARASLQASRFGRDAAALSVAGATARAYVQLLALDAQLGIARTTLAARNETLRLSVRQFDAGYTSRLQLTQSEAEQHSAAQRIPALELSVRRQENALRILTGDLPGGIERGALADLALPQPTPGLPSGLLTRRPDIAQAEAQLISADASLTSARAALLPQVRLTGAIGELFVEDIDPLTVWSLGGSVLAPLFDGGRLAAQSDAAAAKRDQAALGYRAVVLNAFVEVENALEAIRRLDQQRTEAEGLHRAISEALRHATNRYSEGYASYLEALDAQRGLLDVELALVQLQQDRLTNAITLNQALGGGWSPTADQQ